MQKRLEAEISGRVQLVMYRDFAERKARALAIFGTVENLKNGNVYVVAEGEEEKLQEFLKNLRKGPIFAKVTEVKEKWLSPKNEFKNFTVIYYERR